MCEGGGVRYRCAGLPLQLPSLNVSLLVTSSQIFLLHRLITITTPIYTPVQRRRPARRRRSQPWAAKHPSGSWKNRRYSSGAGCIHNIPVHAAAKLALQTGDDELSRAVLSVPGRRVHTTPYGQGPNRVLKTHTKHTRWLDEK